LQGLASAGIIGIWMLFASRSKRRDVGRPAPVMSSVRELRSGQHAVEFGEESRRCDHYKALLRPRGDELSRSGIGIADERRDQDARVNNGALHVAR